MTTRTRIKLSHTGIRELLRSPELRADLTRRMDRVLAQANTGAPEGVTYVMEQGTTDRARVAVGSRDPNAFFAESHTGHLARCLDAAGGE